MFNPFMCAAAKKQLDIILYLFLGQGIFGKVIEDISPMICIEIRFTENIINSVPV